MKKLMYGCFFVALLFACGFLLWKTPSSAVTTSIPVIAMQTSSEVQSIQLEKAESQSVSLAGKTIKSLKVQLKNNSAKDVYALTFQLNANRSTTYFMYGVRALPAGGSVDITDINDAAGGEIKLASVVFKDDTFEGDAFRADQVITHRRTMRELLVRYGSVMQEARDFKTAQAELVRESKEQAAFGNNAKDQIEAQRHHVRAGVYRDFLTKLTELETAPDREKAAQHIITTLQTNIQ